MILSAYRALKTAEEMFIKPPEIHYHDIIPGYVSFEKKTEDGNIVKCLIPAWRVFISEKALQKIDVYKGISNLEYFYDLYGKLIKQVEKIEFTSVGVGTIFKYPDGKSVMLEKCDDFHHKVFVPEPKISIGVKKGAILQVYE